MKNPAAETAGYLNVRNCFVIFAPLPCSPPEEDGECARYPFQTELRISSKGVL
jgi:hypothetical protein